MDYASRKAAIRRKVEEAGADWFFVTNLFNIRYLCGFTGSHAYLFVNRDRLVFITDGRYDQQVREEVKGCEIVIQGTRKDHEAAADALGDLSNARVLFESGHCTFAKFQQWQDKLPAKEYIGQDGMVESLRVVKDEDEIAALRRALEVAEQAHLKSLDFLKEGITERELAHFLEDEMWKGGAQKESFDSLILFGERSSLPHGKPSDRKLKKGDIVLTDFGCLLDGYCSDITRTVCFGEPSDEVRSMYQAVLDSHLAAADAIQAGMTGKEADLSSRRVIEEAGRKDQFIHGLGHGVGLEIHESPRLSYIAEGVLQAGHVVTIEPGVYVPEIGGIRLENMAVVREGGCEVLNQTPIDLRVI
ncbi:Xaa-Pro peptidase family protein [bacterium]|nr:Xaa-Pro peptidase family protein [bacterium]